MQIFEPRVLGLDRGIDHLTHVEEVGEFNCDKVENRLCGTEG